MAGGDLLDKDCGWRRRGTPGITACGADAAEAVASTGRACDATTTTTTLLVPGALVIGKGDIVKEDWLTNSRQIAIATCTARFASINDCAGDHTLSIACHGDNFCSIISRPNRIRCRVELTDELHRERRQPATKDMQNAEEGQATAALCLKHCLWCNQ